MFRILYSDEEFFQIIVHADNPYTSRVLFRSLEGCGSKVGEKYNVPVMLKTDGGNGNAIVAKNILGI